MFRNTIKHVLNFAIAAPILCLIASTGALARYTHQPWPSNVANTQYANIAPLPGAGIAINSEGKLDGLGAMHINIPVAYTPGWGYLSGSVYEGAHIGCSVTEFDNGSGVFALGFGEKRRLYVSAMQVSKLWKNESKAVSFQISALDESEKLPAVAVGEQDMLDKETHGRSPYFVTTKEFQFKERPVFVTVGYGSGRFIGNPFGGVSIPINQSINFAAEFDGYQINTGLGLRPGGRDGKVTLLAAYNGKAGWLAGAAIAGSFK